MRIFLALLETASIPMTHLLATRATGQFGIHRQAAKGIPGGKSSSH